jgi:hypothetical protein
MKYFISRGGQQFGPYTLAEMQKYFAQGQIIATDFARGESSSQWVPVPQVLQGATAPPAPPAAPSAPAAYGQAAAAVQPGYSPVQAQAQPAYGVPAYPQQPAAPQGGAPAPPAMHWGLVLVLAMVTCGIFGIVWFFMQALWIKKIDPKSRAILFYLAGVGVQIVGMVIVMLGAGAAAMSQSASALGAMAGLNALFVVAGVALMLSAMFSIRASMLEYFNSVEPINLRLSGVMTLFFNMLYFQYHMTRIAEWKRTGVLQPR